MLHLARRAPLRLDGAHGLTKRNRNDLAITNILKEYLRIADYQRVCDVQFVLELVVVHSCLKVHVVGILVQAA